MKVEFLEEGESLIARPQGRMEAADGDELRRGPRAAPRPKTKSVTIDLAKLDFINFGAIRAILRLARALKGGNRDLDFLGGGIVVREALDQAGFDDFFPFTPPFVSNRGTPR